MLRGNRVLEVKELRKTLTAVEVLKKYQKQLDPDGAEVGVSRQALDEVLKELERKTITKTMAGSEISTTSESKKSMVCFASCFGLVK